MHIVINNHYTVRTILVTSQFTTQDIPLIGLVKPWSNCVTYRTKTTALSRSSSCFSSICHLVTEPKLMRRTFLSYVPDCSVLAVTTYGNCYIFLMEYRLYCIAFNRMCDINQFLSQCVL